MFGGKNKPSLKERLLDEAASFANQRFEVYRQDLAEGLAKALAVLATRIIWAFALLICFSFVALALSFFLAYLLRPYLGSGAMILSLLFWAVVLILSCYYTYKRSYVWFTQPLYQKLHQALSGQAELVEDETKL